MGNIKSQSRGVEVARGGAPVESDPFAELADILETELQFGSSAPPVPDTRQAASPRRKPNAGPAFDGIDHEFLMAFADELDHAVQSPNRSTSRQPSRSNHGSAANRSPVSMQLRKVPEPIPPRLTDEEIDEELECVLRGLSAPAKPRGRIIVETQSFAPERAAEERSPVAQNHEADDFEELIRSELAVIRPSAAKSYANDRRYSAEAQRPMPMFAEGETMREPSIERHDRSPVRAVPAKRSGSRKRVLATGASVVVLLLAGGVAFGLWSGGPSNVGAGSEPLLIKADAQPYKIQPKEPGGRAYPNQNKAVYDRVASPDKDVDTPMQQALLHNTEEPMELPADDDGSNDLPGVEVGGGDNYDVKDEARLTDGAGDAAETTLQPRKVRTLTVGADGRLVENPAPAVLESTVNPGAEAKPASDSSKVAAAIPAKTDALTVSAETGAAPAVMTPVAAVETTVPTAAQSSDTAALSSDGYFIQIASQPTAEAAQESLSRMSKRYSGVLSGRAIGVKSADIPGKGTYYRVRVAAASKEEALSVCSRLKSAGGTCFVSR